MKKIRNYSINVLKNFKIYQKFLFYILCKISYKLQYIYMCVCVYDKLKRLYQCIKEYIKIIKNQVWTSIYVPFPVARFCLLSSLIPHFSERHRFSHGTNMFSTALMCSASFEVFNCIPARVCEWIAMRSNFFHASLCCRLSLCFLLL